jgi:hypothetical protein
MEILLSSVTILLKMEFAIPIVLVAVYQENAILVMIEVLLYLKVNVFQNVQKGSINILLTG